MSDKTLSFNIVVDGVTNETTELAKLEVQLKNIKKERDELMKQARKGFASKEQVQQLAAYNKQIDKMTASQKELKKVVDSAPDSLSRMRSELIRLKGEYANASAAAREKMAPAINKLNDEVSKAEQAIGVHSRGVGNYKNEIIEAGKSLIGFSGISALVLTVINKLKDAFLATEKGLMYFNVTAEVTKQILYDFIKTGNLNYDNLGKVAEAAKKLNDIRIGDRKDLIEFAKLEREISILEFDAADKTKKRAERQEALNKAIQKQNELSDKKIADVKEELYVINDLLEKRPEDTKLLEKQSELIAKIYNLDRERYEQSKRNESRMTGFIEAENEAFKKRITFSQSAIDEWIKMNALLEKGTDEYARMQDEIAKVIIAEAELAAQRKFTQDEIEKSVKYKAPDGKLVNSEIEAIMATDAEKERLWQEGLEKGRENFRKQKEEAQKSANELIEIDLAKIDQKQAIADAEIAITEGLSDAMMQLTGKNKAFSLAALAVEKASAIARIIANISIANAKSIATSPLTGGQPWVTLNTGLGAVSIAKIIAETANSVKEISAYATGGKIQGGLQIHPDKSKDNTLIYVKQGETVLNESQVARLGGSGAMRKAKVPGYAMGGYVGQQAPEIPSSGFDYAALARLIPKEIVLDINKVNSAQKELQVITEAQRL